MTEWPQPIAYTLGQAVEQLGPAARQKFADVAAMVADAEALVRSLMGRIEIAEKALNDATRRRNYAAQARRDHADLDAEVQAAARSCEKLRTELGRRNATRFGNEQVLSRLRNFVTALTGGMVEMNPPPPPAQVAWQPRAGEGVLDALERVRREIGGAQNELARVKSAPLPSKEIKAQIAALVDRHAGAGAPRVAMKTAVEVEVAWPDMPIALIPGAAFNTAGAASRLLCWMLGDKIKAELCADLPADSPHAIPAADRPGLMREIEARLYGWECGEEKLVLMAQAANLDVQRRVNASCWAILFADGEEQEVVPEAAE